MLLEQGVSQSMHSGQPMEPSIGNLQLPAPLHKQEKRAAFHLVDLDDSSLSDSDSCHLSLPKNQKKICLRVVEGTSQSSPLHSPPPSESSITDGPARAQVDGSQNLRDSHPPIPSSHPPFSKRGVGLQWRTDANVAGHASLHEETVRFLSNLAATSVNILNNNQDTPSLRGSSKSSSVISVQLPGGNSLGTIALRIQNLAKKGMDLDFEMGISFIQFAFKLDILREAERKEITTLIREGVDSGELVSCSECQAKRWRGWGTRLAEFVGSG
jgi:hypothetical protein